MNLINRILIKLSSNKFFHLSDTIYLKLQYYSLYGKKLDLENPQTFNEKLQWLKLYDRKKEYIKMVDKFEVKKYVSDKIGKKYVIPTLGVYNSFDEIDFNKLPNQFVVKCTHDSGGIFICKNKRDVDILEIKEKITRNLKINFYYPGREWPYKFVKPRIIIEKYMEDKKYYNIRDYKFFCFNGEAKLLYVSENSHKKDAKLQFFDLDYKKLDCKRSDYIEYDEIPEKPKNFEKMIKLSNILSKGIPHVRVDWYEIDGSLYFGELTFYTCSGHIPFVDKEWDYKLGRLIQLPIKKLSDKI